MGVILGLEWMRMSKFPDPPINTEFTQQGQSSPVDTWEKWLQAVGTGLTNAPQGTIGTHAQRLKLTPTGLGSTFSESDTGHIFIWFNKWVQLV